jgi:CheY-like chemotaxis protein
MRVLVIEDDREAAAILCDLLEAWKHEVEVAHSGPAGVEAAERRCPDAVICDIALPGLDGYSVCARLRQNPLFDNTRFIALTGHGEPEARRYSAKVGFEHHLSKPVNASELKRLLSDGW